MNVIPICVERRIPPETPVIVAIKDAALRGNHIIVKHRPFRVIEVRGGAR